MEEQIKKYAKLFYSINDIALLLDIPVSEFLDTDSDYYKIYRKAFLFSEMELRKEMIDNAKMGSPAAQDLVTKIIAQSNQQNERNG